ncbi:RILP-like protein 1 [Oryzias melastigma]|uniref:RILP-like protein 2 n=1 Tax=Oryzias melastigma TaxID=30732 RepID=A0A834CKN5_ORYME|nr:RILP-like protein 1 [Oryzias melastigma]
MSALERPAAELTVMDVYDIAAVLGQEFERVIDKFGCECLVGVVPRVVRVLELLEVLVNRGTPGQETEELRREVDRLQRERSDRYEQERRHQKEIEQVEDVWRGEVQDLLSQITQLQAENKRLSVSLSLKESPICEQDQQDQEGRKLQDLVDKQRDEIRAKDHQLSQRNEDIEALQMQQHRLMNMNQDLLHKVGVMEAKGKTLIQRKTELEAAAQAQQKERGALQMEITKLRKELQERESQRKLTELEEFPSLEHTAGPNQLVVDLTDPNRPRFTMQELKEVLQERNQLKAQLMVAQEELQLYKSGILPQAEPAMVEVNLDPPAATEHDPATINEKTTIGKLFSFRRK